MRTFSFRGYTSRGERREGHIEADGRKPALRLLAAQGVFVEQLEPLQGGKALSTARRAILYRELAALLNAGLPLERALQLLMGPTAEAPSPLWHVLAPVRDAVRDGLPVAAALALVDSGRAAYEQAVIEAAERTATLPAMLERLADALDARRAAQERLRSAALYPAFVLTLGVAVAVLLLGVLVPRAQAALAAGGIALPSASLAVVRVARGVAWSAAGLLLALTAGTAALARLCRLDDGWRVRVDRLRLALPGAGRIAAQLAASRFAATLAVLAGAGVPLVDALPLAGAATGNRWLAQRVAGETERVRHGLSLEAAIRAIPPLALPLAEWIRVGEAGGCLDRMLETAARREQAEWERSTARLLTLFEPAVLVAVGLFVLAVALAVLLPVTAMTRGIS